MKHNHLGATLVLLLASACASPPAPVAPPPPAVPAVEPPAPTPAAAIVTPEPAKPAEPTAEEKKKAQDLATLQQDRAKAETDNQAEVARLTPAIHAEAKALAEKTFPSGRAAIQAELPAKYRKPGDAD